jgi:catecholate siderophore receptor
MSVAAPAQSQTEEYMSSRSSGFIVLFVLLISFAAAPAHAAQTPETGSPTPIQRFTFDIPAGSLADTLKKFERQTAAQVQTSSAIDALNSPGVQGTHAAAEALDALLTGTGLTARLAAPGVFVLASAGVARRLEITGALPRYVPEETATATKTPTPLLDVPQTLTVVPRALMSDQHAQSVAEAVRNVPGVSVAQGEGNRDQLVLRGFSSASDFFVNGVRDDQERFRDLYNVQSIEVLQGPAAMLFGRGGAGGVVNLVTAQPGTSAPSEAALEIGAYDHKRATAQIGLSPRPGMALRVSAMGEQSNGFRDGYFLERHAVNPVVGVKLGTNSDLTIGYEHLRDHRLADRGIPSQAGRPVAVPATQLFGSPDQNDATSGVESAALGFEHRFSPSIRLRNSFLAGRYDKFYRNVYPGGPVNASGRFTLAAYDHAVDRVNVFNQTDLIVERRLGGMDHVVLTGIEAGHQSQDELRHTAAPIANVALEASEQDADFTGAPLVLNRHAGGAVLGAYVQDQVTLASRWKAVAGVRVDRFAVAVDDRLPANVDFARTDVEASPRAGIIYQPDQRVSVYGSYSYTFLPSGQTLGLAANTVDLGPENARNYEVGVKAEVFHRRLTVAGALFRLDRSNMKTVDPNDPTRLVLTGQQRTEGFTATAAGRVGSRLELYGGYAAFDARVTRATTAAAAGQRPGLVPRHQGSLWVAADVSSRVRVAGGVVSQTKTYTSFTNLVTLPGFTRLDATLFYSLKGATLSLNAANLTNVRYFPTANGDNNISPGAPRSIQLALQTIF